VLFGRGALASCRAVIAVAWAVAPQSLRNLGKWPPSTHSGRYSPVWRPCILGPMVRIAVVVQLSDAGCWILGCAWMDYMYQLIVNLKPHSHLVRKTWFRIDYQPVVSD
jgi:hypothetical protein